jgi:hypothetical protein
LIFGIKFYRYVIDGEVGIPFVANISDVAENESGVGGGDGLAGFGINDFDEWLQVLLKNFFTFGGKNGTE